MKANEFVKKFGWGWAKDVVNNQPKTDAQIFNPYNQKYSSSYNIKKGVSVAWLKRLVESHELVESFGGLEMAKESLKNLPSEYQSYTMTRDDTGATTQSFKLKQAIADVESCQ